MTFSDDLTYLKEMLAADLGIAALFPSKVVKVIRRYKPRSEIHITDLPVIMITRPRMTASPDSNATGTQEHTMALYCGFHCEDRDQAQDVLIRFEEAIENAIMRDPTLGRRVSYTEPGDSANDEGKGHPVYFLVKEIKISKEIVWQT